jgi:hypothetical protein
MHIARRFVELANEKYGRKEGLVNPCLSVSVGLNIHENDFVGVGRLGSILP